MSDECFPRGGSQQLVKKFKSAEPIIKNLFGKKEKETGGKKQWKKQSEDDEEWYKSYITTQAKLGTADLLTYKTIKEGMLLLGCVSKVHEFYVTVELPGLIHGNLEIKSISNRLNQELKRQIEEETDSSKIYKLGNILTIGTFLPVRISSIDRTNQLKPKVLLSCDPAEVNWALTHRDIGKHMLLWGCIAEKNDYNYIVDIGVKNCRVTLPLDNIQDKNKAYNIGEPLYMLSVKCDIQPEASVIAVTTNIGDKKKNAVALSHLIPAMKVDFVIEKVLENGLQGKIVDDNMGYINEIYLDKKLKAFKVGQTINATVLYTQPMNKFTYFTLRPLKLERKLPTNASVRGIVAGATPQGLLVKINNNLFGLVKPVKGKNSFVREYMSENYPLGSDHDCVVLSHHSIDNVYECAFANETSNYPQLRYKLGQSVKATITGIATKGIYVKIEGKVEGFINNTHLPGEKSAENPASKYRVGQTLDAKILKFNENIVDVTIKPELMNCPLVLGSLDEAMNKQFVGVVVNLYAQCALIAFYGDVKGILPLRNLNGVKLYIGKAVHCFVREIHDGQLTLSMANSHNLSVGDKILSAEIVEVNDFGFKVSNFKYKNHFNLPIGHLASRDLGPLLFKTYKVGDTVENMIVLHALPEIVSCREFRSLHVNKLQLPSTKLQGERLINGSITVKNTTHLNVTFPYKERPAGYNVEVPIDDVSKSLAARDEINDDSIVAKTVDHKNFDFKLIYGVDYKTTQCINYLELYLCDLEALRQRLEATEDVGGVFKVGAPIECSVQELDDQANVIFGVKADGYKAMAHHSEFTKTPKIGKKINANVIAVDYVNRMVHVTMKKSLNFQEIEYDMKEFKNTKCPVEVIHVNSDYCVGSITDGLLQGKLIYLPVKLHDNDFEPDVARYSQLIGQTIDVLISRLSGGKHILGFELSRLSPAVDPSEIKVAESDPEVLKARAVKRKSMEPVAVAQNMDTTAPGEKRKRRKSRRKSAVGAGGPNKAQKRKASETENTLNEAGKPKNKRRKKNKGGVEKVESAETGPKKELEPENKLNDTGKPKQKKRKKNKGGLLPAEVNSINIETGTELKESKEEAEIQSNVVKAKKKKNKSKDGDSSIDAGSTNVAAQNGQSPKKRKIANGNETIAIENGEKPKKNRKKSKAEDGSADSIKGEKRPSVVDLTEEQNSEEPFKKSKKTKNKSKSNGIVASDSNPIEVTNEDEPLKKSKKKKNKSKSGIESDPNPLVVNTEDATKKPKNAKKKKKNQELIVLD